MQKKNSSTSSNRQKKKKNPTPGGEVLFDPLFFNTEDYDHAAFIQKQGEKKFEKAPIQGLKLFDQAVSLEPDNADLLLKQASFLLQYGKDKQIKKYLLIANKKFKAASRIDPKNATLWISWGSCLFCLGTTYNDSHLLYEAKKKFEKSLEFKNILDSRHVVESYWSYGLLLRAIFHKSKELFDLHQALDAFGKGASEVEGLSSQFWEDFGMTSLEMGIETKDLRFFYKAIHCIKNAINADLSEKSYWLSLGKCLFELYCITLDEDHFLQANECFANGIKIDAEYLEAWMHWANLLYVSGKKLSDSKKLLSALEKVKKARLFTKKDTELYSLWIQILVSLGSVTEKLQWFTEAANLLTEMKKFARDKRIYFKRAGDILFAQAKYYRDVDMYYQAIETWQEGLTLDRTDHEIWHNIGAAYQIAAKIDTDPTLLERSLRFYNKAIHLYSSPQYYASYASLLAHIAEEMGDPERLEDALVHFSQAFAMDKHCTLLHPEWLVDFANALDLMGDFRHESHYYIKACEYLKKALNLQPDNAKIQFKLAKVLTHLAELSDERDIFSHALSYFKLAQRQDPESDTILLEFALTLITYSETLSISEEKHELLREAEYKMIQAIKLGNTEAYYHLGCLYSLTKQFDKSIYALKKAIGYGSMPSIEDILDDEWLDNLRSTELFQSIVELIENGTA